MTLRECYEQLGANYDDVLECLMSEEIIKKFALKFLNDPSYGNLCQAMENEDEKEAFRAAHTLKGICLNLGFQNLYQASSALTEHLRNGKLEGSEDLFKKVKEQYETTVEIIGKL